ncbi:hypothetical protein [Tunicatimonas pelagia]|uniref:hypothetical protein n=1 Tax=Tunicatimonas pelagia TaxID=931531 RepID=UPI002665B538|nr:hypothetical protein [Tunicatimonas pelagia]WKN46005.1 hypothetical protein P0M28_13705 [Tunicatimonas pelagia]
MVNKHEYTSYLLSTQNHYSRTELAHYKAAVTGQYSGTEHTSSMGVGNLAVTVAAVEGVDWGVKQVTGWGICLCHKACLQHNYLASSGHGVSVKVGAERWRIPGVSAQV